MDNKKDNISKIESISTIIVNIGTIVSWILTLFTVFVLTSQPQPISLPGLLELNASYKLLFLLSVLFGYIQLLRKQWESEKRVAKDIEGSFGSYIFGSVIRFRRPLVFIGFLIILTIISIIISTEMAELGTTIVVLGAVSLFLYWVFDGWDWMKRQFDDDLRKKWLKRIRNQLHQNGSALTHDFANLPVKTTEINWAIELYFDTYEFEQDLIFSQGKMEKSFEAQIIKEVRFKHIVSRL